MKRSQMAFLHVVNFSQAYALTNRKHEVLEKNSGPKQRCISLQSKGGAGWGALLFQAEEGGWVLGKKNTKQ